MTFRIVPDILKRRAIKLSVKRVTKYIILWGLIEKRTGMGPVGEIYNNPSKVYTQIGDRNKIANLVQRETERDREIRVFPFRSFLLRERCSSMFSCSKSQSVTWFS